MNKDDLHITINVKAPDFEIPDFAKDGAALSEAINRAGLSAAAAGAALASVAPFFVKMWSEVLIDLQQASDSLALEYREAVRLTDLLGIRLGAFWQELEREERKAQQRAQLVLLLAFVLLTLFIGGAL